MDEKHPGGSSFAAAAGLEPEDPEKGDHEANMKVDLASLRELKASASEGPEPEAPAKFKWGDAVIVTTRMTWTLPTTKNPEYRKDIKEGQQGVVEGFADDCGMKVLLKLSLKMPSGTWEDHIQAVPPRNLQLASEYEARKASEVAAKEPASKKAGSNKSPEDTDQVPKWLLGPDSDPAKVRVESKWTSLLADGPGDNLLQTMCLKSRIFIGLHAMAETLPKWTLKDFVVLSRKNDKGVWKGELWTKRDFAPNEILLVPYSSQLKDTNMTASANAPVNLPRSGRGAEPDNQGWALDGRLRNLIATAGTLGEQEHTGSLYWLVTRTPEAVSANLHEELVTFEQHLKLKIEGHVNVSYKSCTYIALLYCARCLLVVYGGPAGKKRKLDPVDWNPAEMPSLPILTNPKGIGKHTKLCMFMPDKKAGKK